MNSIIYPIIVYDNGDLLIFESNRIAESYLEPIDIDVYTAYDCKGHLLKLMIQNNRVIIQLAEREPNHINELRQILIGFMLRLGVQSDWLSNASLQDLIIKSLEYKTQ
ncbi:MAG: hypothetical protein ACKPGT_03580 [Microcystis sp.]|jgi:hypothetical protein